MPNRPQVPQTFMRSLALIALLSASALIAIAQTLTPPALTFSSTSIGVTTAPQIATLTNTDTVALTISSALIGTNFADFAVTGASTCGTTLAVGASCTYSITYDPTTTLAESATLAVNETGTSTNTLQVALSGSISTGPTDTLSATSLNFGSQTVGVASTAQSVTLTNSGSVALTSLVFTLGGTNMGDFATTNTCGGTVAAGSSCTISATFTPTVAGARSATITLTDNAADSGQVITLTGTGVATAVPGVSLSPNSLTFASTNVGTTASAQTVTLTNSGTADLAITSVAITGTNSGDFADPTNTCTGTIAAAATCSISVTFTPSAAGARSATLTITDNAGGATGTQQTVALSGTGAGVASATLSPTSLSFGNSNIAVTTSAQTITLTNGGSAALSITNVTTGGANPGDFAANSSCGTSLAAGASCGISVTFDPTVSGSRSATLIVNDGASGSPQTATLTGTGVGIPSANISPSTLSFGNGNIGSVSAAQSVTLSNSGSGTLNVKSVATGGSNPSDFGVSNTCGTIAAGATCSITVTFDPTAAGSRSATVTVTDNAGNNAGSTQSLSLSGTGVAVPVASPSPTSLNFASSPPGVTTSPQSVTLSNTGTGPLSISGAPSIGGSNAGDFAISSNNCGSSLAASGSCSIAVTFDATAAGARSATLTITDNSGNTSGSTQTVSLTGSGIATPIASLAPTSLGFGTSTAPRTVTLSNTGTGSLSIASSTAISGPNASNFGIFADSCGSSLTAGSSCTISISYTPVSSSSSSAVLTITDNSNNTSGSTQTVTLSGQAGLTILTTSLPNGTAGNAYPATPVVPQGGTSPYTLSISSGSLPAGLSLSSSGVVSGAPTTPGSFTFIVKVTDSSSPVQTATQQFTITVVAPNLAIQTASLSNGTVGIPYSSGLEGQGGTTPYNWSVSSGSLPAGTNLNAGSGFITGTPTSAGTSNFTIKVTDSGSPAQTATQHYSVVIAAPTLTITGTLPNGTVGTAYSAPLAAQGGTAPYSWSISVGSLPPGLLLSSNGAISGTPTTPGSSRFTVKVKDSASSAQTATEAFTLTVNAGLTITTGSPLPSGTVGLQYTTSLTAQSGTLPYVWSISTGVLPTGLTLNAASGIISGMPTVSGTFAFIVSVTDNSTPARSATQPLTLVINSPVTEPGTPTFSFTGASGTVAPGTNITSATIDLSSGSSAGLGGTLNLVFTPNSSITGLPSGYPGDAGFVANDGTKTSSASVTIPGDTTSVAFPTLDPGTVAGNVAITLTVAGASVATSTLTIEPAAPIIEANSVQFTDVTSTGFNVELVATSTTRDLETANFTFNPVAGSQLTGTTTFAVDVKSLLTTWFASSSGLQYGGAFSLTIPFTLSGSSSALGSVSVTLTNSVGKSAAASGVQ